MYKIKLTPYAKIFYTEWLLNHNSGRYNLAINQTFYGNLDASRLRNALKRYISEHLLLNSHIQNIDGEPCWVKNKHIKELEYSNNATTDSSELLDYVNRSFDLHSEPLYRFKLLRIAENIYRFIIVMHHLVMDGSSSLDPGVFEAISNYYNDEKYTSRYSINEQIKLITDLTAKLFSKIEQDNTKHKKFWCQNLFSIDSINTTFLKLSKAHNKKHLKDTTNQIEIIEFSYGRLELAKLNQVKLQYGITPYIYGISIFALLLYKYTGQERLAISYPIAIRDGLDFIYGAQINTNLIPYTFTDNTTIVDLFNQGIKFIKLTTQGEVKYSYYPITNIIQEGGNKNLLDICFAQTFFREKAFEFVGITKVDLHTELGIDGVTKDILLFEQDARISDNNLSHRVRYNKNSFNKELINNFVSIYRKLFSEILEDLLTGKCNRRIVDYKLLTQEQYQKIVCEFNQTDRDYPYDKTVHALFEEQVLKTPNNIAVVYEGTKLTYQQLNNKSNQLANYLLQNYKIKPDDLIALCTDRSEQMLIAMLAILKSGGAYVPIDSSYPDERISYILNDTKTKVVITNKIYKSKLLQIIKQRIINIVITPFDDEEVAKELVKQRSENLDISISSTNLAYVIYTSGTTGSPKGAMIEHHGIVSLVKNVNYIRIGITDTFIQFSDPGFDATTFEIWTPLLNGAKLIIPNNKVNLFANFKLISEILAKNKVTVLWLTKSLFDHLFVIDKTMFKNIEWLLVGGEALNKQLITKLINSDYAPRNVVNGYGPTENTTFSCTLNITKENLAAVDTVPIGIPLANRKAYILDKNLNPLPIGAIGKLYVGGAGLSRGYLNNLNLTAKVFVNNPLQTEEEKLQNKNGKLYKTGDLVRMLPSGNIEYIGRDDFQVKIRGYRIELGEIENKLLKYPGIKQAAVLVKERLIEQTSDKYLLAYYVADKKLDEIKIHAYLTTQLPDYMLPQIFIYLESLPLTANGKLDTKTLPEPEFTKSVNYLPPTSELQNKIIAVWSEILGISKETIGITDSFFSLGGNSILAINLITKLSNIKECKNIKATDIFKYTTVEQLTKFIKPNYLDKNIISTKTKGNIETEIAIIALSGSFSGCESVDKYWELIQKGIEGIKHYTREECINLGITEEVLTNPNFIPASGHIPNIDKFDSAFWGLVANEAKSTDPQIRKLLEHCWYVLEDTGYLHIRDKIKIGVFVGSGNSRYLDFQQHNNISSRDLGYLSAKDILATRVSYLLNLAGAAININTACSTSLTAVIEGCIQLASGFCDMAIAGGVSLLLPWEVGHIYQDGMIYSKDGYCRVFDDKSSGIVHGSGVGVVLLKRLSDAKRDNDHIVAVIKGYGINNDGNRKMSYTSPSIIGQKECIINAQNMARITPELIDYVECHGTGTKLGDPIEIQALDEAFKYHNKKSRVRANNSWYKCIIGSVKANIGHADAAAGIAGLIKVCKMLEHKILPKQINYNAVNPELHLEDTNFEIITKTKKWEAADNRARIAGVSSFGIGGTNTHVIVSEYIKDKDSQIVKGISTTGKQDSNYIIPLSAKSPLSLEAYKKSFIDYLTTTKEDIKNITYTLQLRREHFACRLSIVCKSVADAIHKLKVENNINRINNQKAPNVIFMFPGQGNQYANMSLELYKHDNYYKNIVDECIGLANKYNNAQFEKILFPACHENGNESKVNDNHEINQTRVTQLSLFIVEYSLAKLLESLNINAVSYIGHSIGEYVAATLSGVFSLEDAIRLIAIRGQLMQSMPKGAMLSIQANVTPTIEEIIKNNDCDLAAINSPKSLVVSGSCESIKSVKAELDKKNIPTRLLEVSHAYHSHLMTAAAKEFVSQFNQITLNKPHKSFISNVTGNFITASEATNQEYWARHMRQTVLFSAGIETLFNSFNNLFFIEVGAGKSSIAFVKQHNLSNANTVQLLYSKKEYSNRLSSEQDHNSSLQDICSKDDILNKLWLGGYNVNFSDYYHHDSNKLIKLPNYHFESASYWVEKQNTKQENLKIDTSITLNLDNLENIKNRVVEQNLPDKYYDIANVFLNVLGLEKISVYDDFFKIGGDSLLAVSVVAKLQQNYKVSMDDFLKSPTIAKVVEAAVFVENNLSKQLEKIKIMYSKKEKYLARDVEDMIAKQIKCLDEAKNIKIENKKKDIRTVLLTGATGHVGCNILYQLLHESTYKIYLLIRASSVEQANNKINYKFRHYFDADLNQYKNKIIILIADIERPKLGLSQAQYQELINNIDSIIHAAALVKHYGDYNLLYKANVQATINLLELSKQTKIRDFHYISTVAVLLNGYIPKCSYYVFDENSYPSILLGRDNVYARTKYEGELVVNEYRKQGITANIYRLGNVAMHSRNYRHQINLEDNAFYAITKTLINLGATANEIDTMDISPVDNTALTVVKIFEQVYLSNMTLHIFNPRMYKLSKLFSEICGIPIKIYSINEFIDIIIDKLNANIDQKRIELFMLHQQWLQEVDYDNLTKINIINYKTEAILNGLNFSWSEVNKNMMLAIIK